MSEERFQGHLEADNIVGANLPTTGTELTLEDRTRLTYFKDRYMLYTAEGFSKPQALRLVFMRWLVSEGRMGEPMVEGELQRNLKLPVEGSNPIPTEA
jgi:hypothetical protein